MGWMQDWKRVAPLSRLALVCKTAKRGSRTVAMQSHCNERGNCRDEASSSRSLGEVVKICAVVYFVYQGLQRFDEKSNCILRSIPTRAYEIEPKDSLNYKRSLFIVCNLLSPPWRTFTPPCLCTSASRSLHGGNG
jgi:hypothetical protein